MKAASDIYAPVSGVVLETNEKLDDEPQLINQDSEGEGWILKIKMSNKEQFNGKFVFTGLWSSARDVRARLHWDVRWLFCGSRIHAGKNSTHLEHRTRSFNIGDGQPLWNGTFRFIPVDKLTVNK